MEATENEENLQSKAIDGEISDMISSLLYRTNTHPQMKFSKKDFNHYKINNKSSEVYDNKIDFNEKDFEVSPDFLKLFLKGKNIDFAEFTTEEMNALINFIDYAGGLGRDTRSNLYKAFKSFNRSNIEEVDGDGTRFRSSDPKDLVERFEVLVGESLAGNSNAFCEASAILHELLRMKEITEIENENAMKIFIE